MSLLDMITRVALRKSNIPVLSRSINKSSVTLLDDRWRARNRLTQNPNAFGVLTNLPDYSFKDGRPAPYGVKQMIRINKQREYLKQIKKLTAEIDYAVERHAKLEQENAAKKQSIIDSKLKPKGHPL